MHSILESDGILSDPYEVLCCMGTLIVEGRTPKSLCDSIASGESSETATKTGKPYNEGPHCPNHIKLYDKDAHKCTENNILCIRYNNLRQHLQYLHCLSPSITIEVSLGPDCLCGELRSQSTLVSTQPSKRDTILEQWTITIGSKQSQEATSQMNVLNVYQAVRSLLHFSQLTAWYMSTNGTKPANVIYRVVAPDDATYIADDDFVSHNLPLVDVNKTVSMKISLKTLPRKEQIPTVFCLQHSCSSVDTSEDSRFEEGSSDKNYLSPKPLHPNFDSDRSADVTLPLKFHSVRKKTNEPQERKRKKHIVMYNSPAPLDLEGYSENGILDGMFVDVKKIPLPNDSEVSRSKRTFPGKGMNSSCPGECSKTEFKKSKPSTFSTSDFSELIKQQNTYEAFDTFSCNYLEKKIMDPTLDLMLGINGLSDSKRKSDFRTKGKSKSHLMEFKEENTPEKKTVMDILDDRMQISCAISGKHHCKWECEEENDLNNAGNNAEKPKRRRSLSRVKPTDDLEELNSENLDSDKILHGKFKKADWFKSDLYSPLQESEVEEVNECEKKKVSKFSNFSHISLGSPPKSTTNLTISNNVTECISRSQTPKIESLSLNYSHAKESEASDAPKVNENGKSFVEEASGSSLKEEKKIGKDFSAIRKESFESFRKICAVASNSCSDYVSDSEDELSDHSESLNPFLAAILRTSRKSKARVDSKIPKKCDNSVEHKFLTEEEKEGNFGEKELSSEKGRTSEQNLLREEKLKDSFKSYLSLKSKMELKAKVEECQLESNQRIGGKSMDFCGTNKSHLDLRCGRRKPSAVKGPKEIVGVDESEKNCSGSSELLTKSLTRLKSLFEKHDLKHEERTADSSVEESSNCNTNTKTIPVPSAHDKLKFRRSLDSAAQLVFHRCSGLPLTSSPAPVRRNNNSFSFDSSLNSVSAIKSALFESANSLSSEDENESEGSLKSPASPGAWSAVSKQINYHSLSPLPLLGSFEESVLNGRLEPVSTVQGFTAELGASGSFCPRHLCLPVTVFFYTLGDNDKVSAPYLGHINLGKKGYNVPRSGTIQVTLFNPLRTVVKMFVVVYDLSDMPVNSHTFLRQRTLYVPTSQKESTYTDQKEAFGQEDYHKYLRYLIHLRFVSGKTGRIYLHTDIRMVIFRKADEDTATALGKQINEGTYELRSHTHGPINPKFSPRK